MLYEEQKSSQEGRLTLRAHIRRQWALISGRRITAACMAVIFSFGMSRFYLVVPLGEFICLDLPPVQSSAPSTPAPVAHTHSHGPDHHHDHAAAAAPLSSVPDTGYSFTHCRDTINGIALTPIQPLGGIEMTSDMEPALAWSSAVSPSVFLADSFVPSTFQPPRA
jgi:hypothetical protein